MKIFPAIDLIGGRAVRLTQGDYAKVDVFNDNPEKTAIEFYEKGARYLHVVDLDGAKEGTLVNFDTIKRIVNAAPLFVEVGGGIRDIERIEQVLSLGVKRVILGTAAIKNPEFMKRAVKLYGEQVVVGVDAKDGFVATDGWINKTATDSFSFCEKVRDDGVGTVIYTDIATDGAMKGTNLPAFKRLCGIKGLKVVASGGICTMNELFALRDMGCDAAIVGKAIYTGALDLREVLSVC